MPEVRDRLMNALNLEAMLAARAASHAWKDRVARSTLAWKSCCVARFGEEAATHAESFEAFQRLRKSERDSVALWRDGALSPVDMHVFRSYVRSWASDEHLLIAGLFNGTLQPLDWGSGKVGDSFEGRHGDEVTCIDLGKEYVLSGSGDPGYYQRRPRDSSVKLWRRSDGTLLSSFNHHHESVRGVVLLPSFAGLGSFGLSAGLDGFVNLFGLSAFLAGTRLQLPGPCRSLCMVTPRWRSLSGSEVRVLASAGECLNELAIRSSTTAVTPSLESLRSINIAASSPYASARIGFCVSGLSCYVCPSLWERVPAGAEYPACLLDEAGMSVAGGSVHGELWAFTGKGPARPENICYVKLASEEGLPHEIVSIELLDRQHVLAISRTGKLFLSECLSEWPHVIDRIKVLWTVSGFRMYVSTIKRRQPLLLVSDGFDNAIRTISVDPSTARPDEGEHLEVDEDEDDGRASESEEEPISMNV